MMKRLIAILLSMLLMILPALAAAEGGTAYISAPTADRVHLRKEPSATSESLGLYFTGTQAHIENTLSGAEWALVTIGSERGYIRCDCLSVDVPTGHSPVRRVSNTHSTWVNLRQAPTTQSQSLGRFDNGEAVILLGETAKGWSYVLTNGKTGYMITEMLSEDPGAASATFAPISTVAPLTTLAPAGAIPPANETTILGRTTGGNFIHAYNAPNGQTICFDALEEEPHILEEDVNFDGRNDLVIYTAMGASNFFCEFFVFDGARYQYVEHPGSEYGLPNYELHPQQGLLSTHANNGHAGALHETCLYRWEGYQLKTVRRAVGEEYSETQTYPDRRATTVWNDRFRFRVYENSPETGEGTVIYDETVTTTELSQLNNGIFERETAALWQGLR